MLMVALRLGPRWQVFVLLATGPCDSFLESVFTARQRGVLTDQLERHREPAAREPGPLQLPVTPPAPGRSLS